MGGGFRRAPGRTGGGRIGYNAGGGGAAVFHLAGGFLLTAVFADEGRAVPESVSEVLGLLRDQDYIADRGLAIAIFLALKLRRPLFLEGEAGVGKTEIARALAGGLDTELIRLQCYEGLDINHAVYEWNHTRQLLEIRLLEAGRRSGDGGGVGAGASGESGGGASARGGAGGSDGGVPGSGGAGGSGGGVPGSGGAGGSGGGVPGSGGAGGSGGGVPGSGGAGGSGGGVPGSGGASYGGAAVDFDLFSPRFLIKRPLLEAIDDSRDRPPVLLIDELDRADEEFEGFLLELLADYQITIPELGAFRAAHPPIVIITSNRTREVHDALKRRCLYYWVDYPDYQKELQIVTARLPEAPQRLAQQVTAFIQEMRETELYKIPGVSETLDWTAALLALNMRELEPEVIDDTLGIMLKYQDDIAAVRGEPARALLERSRNRGPRRGGRRN